MSAQTDHTAGYATSIAGWSLALAHTLAEYGVDARAIFLEAGLDLEQVTSASDRLPISAVQQVWRFAGANTDNLFGLRMSAHLQPASLHALGFALWCSSTMKEFFERYIRYRCVLSHLHFCEFFREEADYRLVLVDERNIKSEITNDAATGFFLRMGRLLAAGDFSPKRLRITRSLGAERPAFEAFIDAEVVENSDTYALEFSRRTLEAPLRFANPDLGAQQDAIVERYIADHGLISEYMLRVRTAIQELLLNECVSLERTAEHLHVSPRTLQRRLADEASSYNQLLDDVRKTLALEYIRAPRANATDIAMRLGFSDSGSFGRRFKHWTGISFSQYRRGPPGN